MQQALDEIELPSHMASADEPALKWAGWIEAQWEVGRLQAREAGPTGAVLALDEVQKLDNWSEVVKRLRDEDTRRRVRLHVVLLGSAPLHMERGLAVDKRLGRCARAHVTER